MKKSVIMVVDDDDSAKGLIKEYLEVCGFYKSHEIMDYANGRLAWQAIKEHGWRTDLVVTDYQMPEMNGGEFTRLTKALYPEIKIIIVSGIEEKSLHVLAERSGADAFLKKPFKLKQFFKTIHELLS